MNTPTEKKPSFWALAKLTVTADHCCDIYSYFHCRGASAAHVAKRVAKHFLERIDEGIEQSDGDPELRKERRALGRRLRQFVDNLRQDSCQTKAAQLADAIGVGCAEYELKVLAAGPQDEFFCRFLDALDNDDDFSNFNESARDELDEDYDSTLGNYADSDSLERTEPSEEGKLAIEFDRLRITKPEKMKPKRVDRFLANVAELVENDTF